MTSSRRDFLKHSGLFIAASSVTRVFAAQGGDAIVADTTYGRVRGAALGGVKVFKGIPYGANTTGRNRFMPPVSPAKWAGVRDALAYGPRAPPTQPGRTRNGAARPGARAARRRPRARPPRRERGLPRPEHLDTGDQGRTQAAGDVLVPRRRLCFGIRLVTRHRGSQSGAPR